jgi:hypothetical protein
MKRRAIIAMLVAALAAVGVPWFLYMAWRGFTEWDYAENVPTVDWLPAGATNVSFFRSYSYTAYEFDIDEAGFRAWASDWPVSEIKTPVTVTRYGFAFDRFTDVPYAPDGDWDAQEKQKLRFYAEVKHGLHYRYEQSNGGGVTAAYDRDRHRAYYQESPR